MCWCDVVPYVSCLCGACCLWPQQAQHLRAAGADQPESTTVQTDRPGDKTVNLPKCTSRRVWQGRRWTWRLGKTVVPCKRCGNRSSSHCRSCASRGSTCLSADVLSTMTSELFRCRRACVWTCLRTAVASASLRCVRLAVRSARLGCFVQQEKVTRRWSRCSLMLGCRSTASIVWVRHLFTSRAATGTWRSRRSYSTGAALRSMRRMVVARHLFTSRVSAGTC